MEDSSKSFEAIAGDLRALSARPTSKRKPVVDTKLQPCGNAQVSDGDVASTLTRVMQHHSISAFVSIVALRSPAGVRQATATGAALDNAAFMI